MLWRKLIKEYIYNETKNHYIKIIEKFQTPLESSIIFYQSKDFFLSKLEKLKVLLLINLVYEWNMFHIIV